MKKERSLISILKGQIFMENFEEYDDPILYDKENESYTADIPFLLKWAAKTEGTIIDVACGTGRATIPLAKNGQAHRC